MMEVLTLPIWKTSTWLRPTFDCPDLDAFCLIDRLGLTVTGQRVGEDHTVLACRVGEPDDPRERDSWCGRCGVEGAARDTVLRRLAHVPIGWRPTVLDVTVRRYRCAGCGHVWRQDTTSAAAPRSKLSRAAVLWALKSVVIDRLSIARVAEGLGASWHTANDAVLTAGRQLLIEDPTRLDGVRVLGVDEHCWRHPRAGAGSVERFVTVIIDLTPVRDGTGPARLLDMVSGRSEAVFSTWLAAQSPAFRAGIELSVASEQHPHTLDQHSGHLGDRIAVAVRGAPDAMRVARPVRRAGRGNGPGAILTPRPGSTPTSSERAGPRSARSSSAAADPRSWCIGLGWRDGARNHP